MTYASASFPTTPDYADVPDADWTPGTLNRARRRVERNRRINASYGPEPWETTETPRGPASTTSPSKGGHRDQDQ